MKHQKSRALIIMDDPLVQGALFLNTCLHGNEVNSNQVPLSFML